MTAPGTFAPDSGLVGGVGRVLAPRPQPSPEDLERLMVAYERYRMAREAQLEEAKPGLLAGIGRGALQGLTFGFGDEIVARLRSLGPATYSEAVQGERDALTMFRSDHPYLSFGAELAGGLVMPGGILGKGAKAVVGGTRAAARATLAVRMGRAAMQGAVYGGLYGAGSGEGGVTDRLQAGLETLPTGAAIGAAFPAAGAILRKTGVAQLAGRTSNQAKNYVLRVMQESRVTPQQLKDRLLQASEKPEMLVDLIGEQGQRLAEGANVFNTPGAAALGKHAERRMAGQSERIISGVRGAAKLPPEDVTKTVEQLIGERAAQAKPLYDLAYTYGELRSPMLSGAGLKQMLATPGMQRAYREAKTLAAEEGVTLPELEEVTSITVQVGDYLKRALDDVIYLGRRSPLESGGLGPGRIRALKGQRAKLLAAMDDEVPVYAQARQAFEGPTSLIEALEDGQRLWSRADLDAAMADFGRLSASEQSMYRRGAIDGLRGRLEEIGDSRDKLKGFFDSPADRRRLRVALGDANAANQFKGELEREITMAETRNVVRANSSTARRTEAANEISGLGLRAIVNAVSHPFQTGGAIIEGVGNVLTRGRSRANEISKLLAAGEGGRNQLLQILDELIDAEQAVAQRGATVRRVYGVLAGQTASGNGIRLLGQ